MVESVPLAQYNAPLCLLLDLLRRLGETTVSGEARKFSLHAYRRLTVAVLIAGAVAITLANLSSEPVTGDHIKEIASRPERAYGWPLTCYWRVASTAPGKIKLWMGGGTRPRLQWQIARCSASRLMADVAIWLVMLAGAAAGSQRLLGKYGPQVRWRPRLTTLLVLLAVAAPIVLANMTFEVSWSSLQMFEPGTHGKALFGWPLIWNWYFVAPFDNVYGWDFSAARLAGNIVMWLATLAAVAWAWEWLLHRYQPRLRFTLRTMLAAVALVSLLCAWSVKVQKRAQEQDALVEFQGNATNIRVERWWGPKWLALVVPDRFRRCVVGADVAVGRPICPDEEQTSVTDDDEDRLNLEVQNSEMSGEVSGDFGDEIAEDEDRRDAELLERLRRLPDLRFLEVECGLLTPAMADALAELRQLRMLEVRMAGFGRPDRPANIAWVGHLRELEQLSLQGVGSEHLACLANLTRLKSLMLDITDCENDEREMHKRLAMIGKLTQLRRVRLEGFPGARIAELRSLTNLKSLIVDFDPTHDDRDQMHECFEALGRMTQIEQLHLGLREGLRIHPQDLECLRGLKNLKSLRLHIAGRASKSRACLIALGELTQLRRLWLEGDLVSRGLADLAPLRSLEELTSDNRMATPAALESLIALRRLKAVHIAGLDLDLASSNEEAAEVRRALESLRRSHPKLVLDSDYNSRWLDAQKQDYPSLRWEPFDDRTSDLEFFLGFVFIGP
ncbi:MAG TPA: hypothetical protein VJ783_01220 [Pirellulales bacterium]|nr:hypothetical protein [Pirellulales bacterium]